MSRKHFPIEGKRIRGRRGMGGSALTRRLRAVSPVTGCRGGRPPRDDPYRASCYFLDDSAAAASARSAPGPAVTHHA